MTKSPSPKKPSRERAIAGADAHTGQHRYHLYKAAFERVTHATRDGYYLEAITLIESLLSDRMESRASFLAKENIGFKNLNELTERIRKLETVTEFVDILERVDEWRRRRNKAMHELVKFEPGDLPHVG